jgi:ABC-type nickel/cobalt efflux system permease component RcnA
VAAPGARPQPRLLDPLERERPALGRLVKRLLLLAVLAALAAAAALPGRAAAHPLGNFTVNRSAQLEVSGSRLYVSYVLDLAEIPTFQDEQAGRGRESYLQRIRRGVRITVDGRAVRLVPVAQRLVHPPGQGGLRTTRYEAILAGPVLSGRARVTLVDRAYDGRIGWKEVVVHAGHGASVVSASVPSASESDRLRSYPAGLLHSPLDVTTATATVAAGPAPGPAPALDARAPAVSVDRAGDGAFTRLISRGRLSAWVILLSLGVAAFWGAVHALTPGHGKALVAGYLVGTRGRPRDAVLLGATVTVTHTIGVFALGLVTLLLSQFVVPETLYPWLTLVSGVLVVGVGLAVLVQRLRGTADHHHHDHDQHHGHHHHHHHHGHGHHEHGHGRGDHAPLETRGILGVGVAAGILPCPSALVVLLSAIALHRVGFGILLILAFSLGLAATITGIGLVAVLARRAFGRLSFEGRLVRLLPAVSALVILCVGIVLTARAVPDVV